MESKSYELMIGRIKERMFQLGLNARTLAEKADVGKSFIYDVLRGKSTNPTSGKLLAIADILGVPLSYLIGNTDSVLDSSNLQSVKIINDVDSDGSEAQNSGVYFFNSNVLYKGDSSNLSLCRMFGDDMYPTIKDMEWVLFDTSQNTVEASGIFVISDKNRITIRRIEYNIVDSSNIRIIPDNAKYSYSECSAANINILGRVVMRIFSL